MQGIIEAYQVAVRSVRLCGPTNFSPIINHVSRFAWKAAETSKVSMQVATTIIEGIALFAVVGGGTNSIDDS